MQAPEIGGATRQNATQLFMSLLTYGQIGIVDLNQEFEGKQTFKDIKKGKFSHHDFLGMNPFIWDVVGSAILIIVISFINNRKISGIKEPSFR